MNDLQIFALLSSLITRDLIDKSLFCDISEEKWKKIFELCCPHGIAPVVYDTLLSLPPESRPPKMVQISWFLEAEKAEKSYAKKCSLISRLSAMLAFHDMEFVLLKGASTASYYPIPEHRYFGDIDFYVIDRSSGLLASKEADRLISENFDLKTNTDQHHHNTYHFEGVLLENHYDFIQIHSHKSSVALEAELKRLALAPRETVTLPTQDGPVTVSKAPATFNAVFLLRHMASHFAAAEIGLRHLLDYALFLKAEHQNIDFPLVRDLFDRFHLTEFSSAVNSIITEVFHLPKEFTTGVFAPKELSEKVLQEVTHPAFPTYKAEKNGRTPLASISFRTRRFFANRWKHDLVYPENFYATLFRASYSHLLKPKTLLK